MTIKPFGTVSFSFSEMLNAVNGTLGAELLEHFSHSTLREKTENEFFECKLSIFGPKA